MMNNIPRDSASPNFAATLAAWWRQPVNRVAVVSLAVYAAALCFFMGAYAGGPDQSGYLNNAKLISKGMVRADRLVVAGADVAKLDSETFVPIAFVPTADGKMVAFHPAGLPAVVAALAQVTGWRAAPHVAMLLASLLGLLATAWLARAVGLPWGWSWLGVLMLAGSALYINMSVQLMSDVPALACVTVAVILAWKSRKRDSSDWWALAAGVMVACAVFVRPTNALVVVPVAVCLGLPWLSWRRWLLLALGGFPGAVLWCLYNHASNGSYLKPGYNGNAAVGTFFSLQFVPATLLHYAHWLPVFFTPLVLALLALPWFSRGATRLVAVLIAWIVPFFALYATYVCTQINYEFLRFVLPAAPACIVGALWVMHGWVQTPGGARVATRFGKNGAMLLALTVLVFDLAWIRSLHPERAGKFEGTYATAAYWMNAHFPEDAVVLGRHLTGAVYCYTSFPIVRLDRLNATQWEEIKRVCVAAHRPVYAAILTPYDYQTLDVKSFTGGDGRVDIGGVLAKTFPGGNWKPAGAAGEATFWKLEMPGKTAQP